MVPRAWLRMQSWQKKIQIFPPCSWVILSLFFPNMAALLELVDPDPQIFYGSYLVFYFTEMLFLLLFC